jgi:tetratricopeptide (TPR) repeat protein
MRRPLIIGATAVLLGFSFLSAPAFAMGGSGDTSGSSKTVQKCKKNEVWDKNKKKCVVPKQGMLDDESIFEAGRDLAYAGRYDEAINVLTMAANKEDPRILNFLGYAHRKSGRVNVGLGYYQEALRMDQGKRPACRDREAQGKGLRRIPRAVGADRGRLEGGVRADRGATAPATAL